MGKNATRGTGSAGCAAALWVLLWGCAADDFEPPRPRPAPPPRADRAAAPRLEARPTLVPGAAPPGAAVAGIPRRRKHSSLRLARRRVLRVRVSEAARALLGDDLETRLEGVLAGTDLQLLRSSDRSGIDEVLLGRAVAALAAVRPSDAERQRGLCGMRLGRWSLVVAVHEDQPLRSLSLARLRDVLGGRTRTWVELGGRGRELHVVFAVPRELTARAERLLVPGDHVTAAAERKISGRVALARLAHEPTWLVVTDLAAWRTGARRRGVRLLALDGVRPSPRPLASGCYPASGELWLIFRCAASRQVGDLRDALRGEALAPLRARHLDDG